jgi:type IV pilus assembly protein PilM
MTFQGLLLRNAPAPVVAVELAGRRVSAATIMLRGGRPVVAMHAAEALPAGALVPSLVGQNVADRSAVTAALGRVLDQVGRPRRIGLILPDTIAKVSIVHFDQLPARVQDLDQLVRWQVRKAAPFPIAEAQVSYVAGASGPGAEGAAGHDVLVSVARRAVVEEYEALCTAAGAHAGLIDISTFNVVNAILAGTAAPAADWLLVHVAADYTSIAVLRGADVIFFRSRESGGEGSLADLVHQTAMYYEDRLRGGGFTRVMLSGASASLAQATDVDQIRRSLEARLGMTVETVDVRAAVTLTDRIAAAPVLLDTLAPLVGLLLRDIRDAGAAA